jgi:uncharacterized protein
MVELSPKLFYHGFEHVENVLDAAREIGESEYLSPPEWDILNTAILLHDSGFMHVYKNHEEEGCAIAEKLLPNYKYSRESIEIVKGIIMATKIPQRPKNKLERIIADADLFHLGSDNFAEVSEKLYLELSGFDLIADKTVWLRSQISFLDQHIYFTEYCRTHKGLKKEANLELLREQLIAV